MKKLLYSLLRDDALLTGVAQAETVSILMEGVPDTEYVKALVPEFEKATGITVNLEVVNYAEMHTKLVPQLVARQGSYSAIVVDFYWVGEFTKAGWLQPLDERIAADKVDTSVYVPAMMDLVGKVDGVTYMLPFYNYAMGLLYRTDLLADEKNKADFQAKYGMELRKPETWDEYLKQVEFFTKDGMYGVVNQGLRPDPIAMEWSNYLFANGGEYHDANWKSTVNTDAGQQGARAIRDEHREIRPARRRELQLRRGVQRDGAGPGLQLHHLQLLPRRRRRSVEVAGRRQGGDRAGAGHRARQGRQPERRLGLGHSEVEPQSRRGMDLPEVGRVARHREEARACRRLADPHRRLRRCRGAGEIPPFRGALKKLLLESHNFPTFTYTPQFVEVLGRELSLAVGKEKTPEEALAQVATEFDELAAKDGKQK